MTNLICVFGMSGAGKTHFSNRVEDLLGYENIHCIGHLKRYYEQTYGLPEGALDTEEGKAYVPPGADSSMGTILIELYHFWQKHDNRHSTRRLSRILRNEINQGKNICLNAIRNVAEGVIVNTLKKEYGDKLKVIKIWIARDEAIGIDTDVLQEEIFGLINADRDMAILNAMEYNCFDDIILEELV